MLAHCDERSNSREGSTGPRLYSMVSGERAYQIYSTHETPSLCAPEETQGMTNHSIWRISSTLDCHWTSTPCRVLSVFTDLLLIRTLSSSAEQLAFAREAPAGWCSERLLVQYGKQFFGSKLLRQSTVCLELYLFM
ncbi:hypothetical protein BDR07DRAFT_1429919 [Suillus spraguei]|nr:hypothetical protein BDR07DRAFT_1429919 [Suillus spraguei]